MEKRYKNVSGQPFFFPDLGNKKVPADPNSTVLISEKDLAASELLSGLVKKGFLVEVTDYQKPEIKIDPINKFEEPPVYAKPPLIDRPESSHTPQEIQKEEPESIPDTFSFGSVKQTIKKEASIVSNVSSGSVDSRIEGVEAWWCGPANDMGGYGKMNRYCVEGLHAMGAKIQLDLFKIPDQRSAVPISLSMQSMLSTTVSEKAPSVWAILPPKFLQRQGRKIMYTMIETEGVPKSMIDKVNMADELWLPSLSNVRLFTEAKVIPTIKYMPLGVDLNLFKPMSLTEEQRKIFKITTKSFVFSSLFGWSLRKGIDILLKAYLEEFTAEDDVTLIIASRLFGSTHSDSIGKIRENIRDYINRWCPNKLCPPHIVHIGQSIPEESLPILFNMSDAFVLPSRGEGFGLPYCEAGACQIPVIATRCGGQLDFLNDQNSYLVDVEGFSANKDVAEVSSYYEGMPFANLGEKSVGQLREMMRHVTNNREEARNKAVLLRKNLEESFNWNHLIKKCYDRLAELQP